MPFLLRDMFSDSPTLKSQHLLDNFLNEELTASRPDSEQACKMAPLLPHRKEWRGRKGREVFFCVPFFFAVVWGSHPGTAWGQWVTASGKQALSTGCLQTKFLFPLQKSCTGYSSPNSFLLHQWLESTIRQHNPGFLDSLTPTSTSKTLTMEVVHTQNRPWDSLVTENTGNVIQTQPNTACKDKQLTKAKLECLQGVASGSLFISY